MILGDLYKDQHHTVGVEDMHLVQPPRLAAGLAGDLHTALLELFLRRMQVPYLKPQRAGKWWGAVVRGAVAGEFDK